MKEYNRKDYLWITPETSGSLLLGDKTQKEQKKEDEQYALNKLNEDENYSQMQ